MWAEAMAWRACPNSESSLWTTCSTGMHTGTTSLPLDTSKEVGGYGSKEEDGAERLWGSGWERGGGGLKGLLCRVESFKSEQIHIGD